MKRSLISISTIAILFLFISAAVGVYFFKSKPTFVPNFTVRPAVLPSGHTLITERLNEGNPVISKDMFAALGVASEGDNINGPCVVALPDWLPIDRRANSAANYYMYFARHGKDRVGDYIRLAWATKPEGPWNLYKIGDAVKPGSRGVLDLGESGGIQLDDSERLVGTVGSPDAIIDHANRRFILYFHAKRGSGGGAAFVATSPDGLDFNGSYMLRGDGHGIRGTPLGRT